MRLDHKRILKDIRPTVLPLAKYDSVLSVPGLQTLLDNFSIKDLGRGMLNHDYFCLVEALALYSEEHEFIAKEKVNTSNLDNLLLSLSLKAYLKSKKTRHKCNLAFLIPPFSYSFALLIAYHLVLQHLAETISPELNAKFPPGTGILIVSDNIELYSHIGRTSIQNNHLWQYIKTYEIKANKFNPFSFSADPSFKKNYDGTLPWISLFRAVRHNLPEALEMAPQVIILDFLPHRHRNRASELIAWAKSLAQHVIVIAPLFDDNLYHSLKSGLDSVIPIENYTTMHLQQIFDLTNNGIKNAVTASWSLSASQPYFQSKGSFDIHQVKGVALLEEIVEEIEKTLLLTISKDGSQNQTFKKVKSLVNDMLSLPIPVELYERIRELNGKPKLIDIIKSTLKIPPGSYEEKKLFDHILPQLIRDVTSLYDLLISYSSSPKGEALLQLLPKDHNNKTTIIVSNKLAAQEIKIWIRMKMKLSAKDIEHVKVLTQNQWAKQHLNEIYNDANEIPNHVILVNPWSLKYLSSFFIHEKTTVSCIAYKYEVNLYRYQINRVYSQNNNYVEDLIHGFMSIHKTDLSSVAINTKNPKININSINVKYMLPADTLNFKSKVVQSIDTLFDHTVLFSMIGVSEDEEFDQPELNILDDFNEKMLEDSQTNQTFEFLPCIKITGVFRDQDEPLVWFIPTGILIKIVKDKTLINLGSLELKQGDTWVIFKHDQRRELFDTILKMSSNTMIMKWIEMNVAEWRDMVALLWHQFHETNSFKKHTYEKILNAIQKHGGKVETTYTIANWINGDVSSVKYIENVRAVAEIIGESNYLDKWNTIHKAMRRLWNIHIKLGKVLGAIISDSAAKNASDFSSEWVDIGLDIKLPLDDIMASIQLIDIQSAELDKDYLVANAYTEIPITEKVVKLLEMKGLINSDEN